MGEKEKTGSLFVSKIPEKVYFKLEEKKAQLQCNTWLDLVTKIANAELKNGKLIVEA